MTVYAFPMGSFTVEGNPEGVRESAQQYGRFATMASEAATHVRSLTAGGWVGDEGDLYRAQAGTLPPMLDTATAAFSQVAAALNTFADQLADAQTQMAGERAAAQTAYSHMQSTAQTAATLQSPGALTSFLTNQTGLPPSLLSTGSTLTPDQQGAVASATAAHDGQVKNACDAADAAAATYGGHLHAAQGINARVQDAATVAGNVIRAAGQMSPTANQNWFSSALDKVGNWFDSGQGIRRWLGEHAGILRGVGQVLSWVGDGLMYVGLAVGAICAVAGFFSAGVGWLGDIPAGAMIAIGATLSFAGDGMQTAADWGEGKIDGRQLVIEGLINIGLTTLTFGLGKAVTKIGPKLAEKFLPDLGKKWDEWLAGRRGVSGTESPVPVPPRPTMPAPSRDYLPGRNAPLIGGSKDSPFVYQYKSDYLALKQLPKPSAAEMRAISQRAHYADGSKEALLQRWQRYQSLHVNDPKAKSWETWRNMTITANENNHRGSTFEHVFAQSQGFSPAQGWQEQVAIGSRRLDLALTADKIGYELKSGNKIDMKQAALDADLVAQGWQITYVFAAPPSAAEIARLTADGIRYSVWNAVGVPIP